MPSWCPSPPQRRRTRRRWRSDLDPEIARVALRLLASREHSRLELQRKLCARGHAPAAVDAVLDGFGARGLLSDERMTEAYVEERLRKGFGPLRVRQELRERGIANALIDRHLERSPGDWLATMVAVHDRKFGAAPAGNAKELGRRARFLAHRGFSAELIGRFLCGDDEI